MTEHMDVRSRNIIIGSRIFWPAKWPNKSGSNVLKHLAYINNNELLRTLQYYLHNNHHNNNQRWITYNGNHVKCPLNLWPIKVCINRDEIFKLKILFILVYYLTWRLDLSVGVSFVDILLFRLPWSQIHWNKVFKVRKQQRK